MMLVAFTQRTFLSHRQQLMRLIIPVFLLMCSILTAEPMKPEFTYTTFIAKPAQTVWNALTQKKTIDQYYLAPVHTLELKQGGKISYGGEQEMISGTITKLEAPKTLTHTFNFAGSKDAETTVSYSVEAFGDKMCALTVTHGGFKEENQTYANVAGGWPVIISSLKTLLETGKPMPWPHPE